MINLFFQNINSISVLLVVLTFLIIWASGIRAKKVKLDSVISRALAAGTIPTSVALLICAFDKQYITNIQDLSINLAVAALVLFFVACQQIWLGMSSEVSDK